MAAPKSQRKRESAVIVRSFEPEDAEAVAQLHAGESLRWGTLHAPMRSIHDIAQQLLTPSPGVHLLVAEVGGELTGVGRLSIRDEPRLRHGGDIDVLVAAHARYRDTGGALLDALITLAERWLGLFRLQLNVWVDDAAGVGLYRSRNFNIEGVARAVGLRDGVLVDAFTMARVAQPLPWPRLTAEEAAGRTPPKLPPQPKRSGNGERKGGRGRFGGGSGKTGLN